EREQADIAARITQAEQTAVDTQAALEQLRQTADSVARQAAGLRDRREKLLFEIEERSGEQREFRSELEEGGAACHDTRLRLGEVRVRIEDLEARTSQELGVSLAEQYATYQPENDDWAAVEVEIEDLRAKIERLGNVNLDAIAEQDELEQRHGFL